MKITIQVIKVYDVETEGGDTCDFGSCMAHLHQVNSMSSEEIERTGKLVGVTTDYAEITGPDDCEGGE